MATNGQKAIPRPEMYTIRSILDFGKYKGNTVEDILHYDPGYILWAIDNIEWFRASLNVTKQAEINDSLNF